MESKSGDNGGRSDKMVASMSFKTKLREVPKFTSERCIYRVPRTLRAANEEAYTPQLVSVGPYHRGTPRLQSMEVIKLRYVDKFLKEKHQNTVEFYVEELTKLEKRARQCYEESVDHLASNEFVEMLLFDCCFIVELMLVCCTEHGDNISDFRCPSLEKSLKCDLQLMETQLPFFVLEHLFNLINSSDYGNRRSWPFSFLDLVSSYFTDEKGIGRQDIVTISGYQIKHFLDFYTAYYVPTSPREEPKSRVGKFSTVPSITELHQAGVKFRKVENTCFLDIKFTDTGLLSIPHIQVTGQTELILRNCIAFEYFNNQTFHVTDYACLMEYLVNTPNDVAILRSNEVLESTRSDEEVSHLYKMLNRGTTASPEKFYYSRLCQDVNVYYKKRWNIWRAILKRDYFNTPWSTLSFIAAAVLLICTLVQSVYSVIAVYQ